MCTYCTSPLSLNLEIIPAPVLEEKREDNSKLPMAKKKQSKAAWRKRGLSFEEDTRVARERAEQELRTGGSLEHTSDEHLFVIDAGTGCSKAAAPPAKRRKPSRTLFVDRNIAVNPHLPVINRERQLADIARAKASQMLKQKLTMLRKKAAARREQPPPATLVMLPAGGRLGLWDAPLPMPKLRSRPLDAWGDQLGPINYRPPRPGKTATAAAMHVVPASEGASYNPSFNAHQKLLEKAVAHELERQRQVRINSSAAFSKYEDMVGYCLEGGLADEETEAAAAGQTEEVLEQEQVSAQLGGKTSSGEEEDEEDKESSGLPILNERLTVAQRNRRRRHKERLAAEAAEAKQRKSALQLARVVAIESELKKDERRLLEQRRVGEEKAARRRKRLGKERYREPRPEVLLTEELSNSLRSIPAAVRGILDDRYDSMVQRNMLEPRKRRLAFKRKLNRREYTKESQKDTRFRSPHALKSGLRVPVWMA